MPLTSSILALRLYLQHENTMKLPLLFAILTMTTALSAQNLKISPTIEQQLKELDEIVENKASYHAERETSRSTLATGKKRTRTTTRQSSQRNF